MTEPIPPIPQHLIQISGTKNKVDKSVRDVLKATIAEMARQQAAGGTLYAGHARPPRRFPEGGAGLYKHGKNQKLFVQRADHADATGSERDLIVSDL